MTPRQKQKLAMNVDAIDRAYRLAVFAKETANANIAKAIADGLIDENMVDLSMRRAFNEKHYELTLRDVAAQLDRAIEDLRETFNIPRLT